MDTPMIICAQYLYMLVLFLAGMYFFLPERSKQKQMTIAALIALPSALILGKIAGQFYFDPRPFVIGHFTPLILHAADNGFPSDHALLCFTVSFLVLSFNRRLGGLLLVLSMIVGLARVSVGMHHVIDIMGSAGIGMMAVCVCALITRLRSSHFPLEDEQS